jgi:TPR repeat protein
MLKRVRILTIISLCAVALTTVLVAQSPLAAEAPDFAKTKPAAEKGDPKSQYHLGLHYLKGIGTQKNTPEAIRWLIKAAEQGNLDATVALGQLLSDEVSGALDRDRAVYWLNRAVEQNSPRAKVLLGQMLANGSGVPKDEKRGLALIQEAAQAGTVEAYHLLGHIHRVGAFSAEKDVHRAAENYRRAAEKEYAPSMVQLGYLLRSDDDDPAGAEKAVEWFRKAADLGDPEGQGASGNAYYKGLGVEKDFTEAARWMEKAARQGLPRAQSSLASYFHLGTGRPKDLVQAYAWAKISRKNGDDEGTKIFASLAMVMTPEQIKAGDSRAAEIQLSSIQGAPGGMLPKPADDEESAPSTRLAQLRKVADEGGTPAIVNAAVLLMHSAKTDEELSAVRISLEKAPDDPEALYYLGEFYRLGKSGGVEATSAALSYYQKAAEKGEDIREDEWKSPPTLKLRIEPRSGASKDFARAGSIPGDPAKRSLPAEPARPTSRPRRTRPAASRIHPAQAVPLAPCERRRDERLCCYVPKPPERTARDNRLSWPAPPTRSDRNAA